jgi:hypothetical protein
MTEVVRLRQAIRDLHGLESEHIRSEPVHETFCGETLWTGTVEVFRLFGHRAATEAYAWSHETHERGRRYVAVLRLPPVKSAQDAMRASLALEAGVPRGRRASGPTAVLSPFELLGPALPNSIHYIEARSLPTALCETLNSGGLRRAMELPSCQKCNDGTMVPLSDYGPEGSDVVFKVWVCVNPKCGFSIRVDKGEVTYGKKIEHKH